MHEPKDDWHGHPPTLKEIAVGFLLCAIMFAILLLLVWNPIHAAAALAR